MVASRRITVHDGSNKREHTSVQEHQEDRPHGPSGGADNRSQEKGVDGGGHPVFHLTVTALLSDKRQRDLDGMLSTICDCLVRAADAAGMNFDDNIFWISHESVGYRFVTNGQHGVEVTLARVA